MSNHLWYTAQEFVVFALVSDLVTNDDKKALASAISLQPGGQCKPGRVEMPLLVPGCTLASHVGPQSVHFFEVLGINRTFLDEPISDWPNLPTYQKFCKFVKNLPLTNDHTERMIKRTSNYANFGPTKESEFQDYRQLIVPLHEYRVCAQNRRWLLLLNKPKFRIEYLCQHNF